jgi:hypothetical protein
VGTLDEEIAVETHDYALSRGRHAAPDRGRCAMEWIAELTGEPHTDRPRSTSEVAAEYVRHFNDVLADGPRQRLRPYLARMIGTAGDGLDELRAWSCALRLTRECLPVALDAAHLEPLLGDDVSAARVAAGEARAVARERASRACRGARRRAGGADRRGAEPGAVRARRDSVGGDVGRAVGGGVGRSPAARRVGAASRGLRAAGSHAPG